MKLALPTIVILLVLVLAGCATPFAPDSGTAPTSEPAAVTTTPEAALLDGVYTLEDTRVSFRYPARWVTRGASRSVTLADSDEALNALTLTDTLVIQVDATPRDSLRAQYGADESDDLSELLRISSTGPEQAGYRIGGSRPFQVGQYDGLTADLLRQGAGGRLAVIATPTLMVRVLGQASAEGWERQQATFDAIVTSFNFDEEEALAAAAPPADPPATPPEPAATGGEAVTPTPDPNAAPAQDDPAPAAPADGDPAPAAPADSDPAPANPAQPELISEGEEPFVLRLGGSSGDANSRFVSARGLDSANDGRVFLAESSRGIWVFDPDGALIETFGGDTLLDAYDVAVAPNGDIFVADYGQNAIIRFRPDGTEAQRWGAVGDAPDQFGPLAPRRLTIGADGSVYAIDNRVNAETNVPQTSIVRFQDDGTFIERVAFEPGVTADDLAVDRAGNIYTADSRGGKVTRYAPNGEIVATFTDDGGGIPVAVDLDGRDNIYVATNNQGIVRFAPDGTLLMRAGTAADAGAIPQPGQFSLPNGIAAAPGEVVWVSDNAGEYSAVTALRMKPELLPTAAPAAEAEADPAATPTPLPEEQLFGQWAARATASASFEPDYAASNLAGPPDVDGCRSSDNAWAAPAPDTRETVMLTYDTPVFAVRLNIYQTHQPGSVTKVELRDEDGEYVTIYEGTASLLDDCPFVQTLDFAPTLTRVDGVRLTIDQTTTSAWNELDAVELVGYE